jgi:hypothetical protein
MFRSPFPIPQINPRAHWGRILCTGALACRLGNRPLKASYALDFDGVVLRHANHTTIRHNRYEQLCRFRFHTPTR